jgi:hypothetical protein
MSKFNETGAPPVQNTGANTKPNTDPTGATAKRTARDLFAIPYPDVPEEAEAIFEIARRDAEAYPKRDLFSLDELRAWWHELAPYAAAVADDFSILTAENPDGSEREMVSVPAMIFCFANVSLALWKAEDSRLQNPPEPTARRRRHRRAQGKNHAGRNRTTRRATERANR